MVCSMAYPSTNETGCDQNHQAVVKCSEWHVSTCFKAWNGNTYINTSKSVPVYELITLMTRNKNYFTLIMYDSKAEDLKLELLEKLYCLQN